MTIAIYAGSFDPITLGHVSVIRQAVRLFSHVRVLIAVNPEKLGLFDQEARTSMIQDAVKKLPNVSIDHTAGLVVEYAQEIAASVLVRGIRGASDAEGETKLAQINRSIAPQIATILLPAELKLAEVSSSALKRMAEAGDDISAYCSPFVSEQLFTTLSKEILA
ncbi:MAG: pantetheine-phosphate adenylyltransferase [Myxococcales bacterium]|nr:pantetheine-phosphate adenylyltransferase [Myxococcales bacterium]